MKEYPSTSKQFKVNGKVFEMKKITLGLQSRIEDENIAVTYRDLVEACTNMEKEDIDGMDPDQFESLYTDISDFTYTSEKGDGEPKKPSS
jgi:hypothetical protein